MELVNDKHFLSSNFWGTKHMVMLSGLIFFSFGVGPRSLPQGVPGFAMAAYYLTRKN